MDTNLTSSASCRRFARVAFVLSCVLMAVDSYDMQILGYAAPSIMADIGASRAAFGLVFSLNLLGYMVGAIVLGSASDRVGRRKVITLGLLVFGIATLATVWCSTIEAIAGLRFIAGIGLGGAIPTTIALNAEYVDEEKRGRHIVALFFWYSLGGALTGLIAAALLPRFGWESLFIIGGIAPIVLCALFIRFVPEPLEFHLCRGEAKLDLAKLSRQFDLEESSILAALAARSRKQPKSVSPRELFAPGLASITLLLWLCCAFNFMSLNFLTSWLPTTLGDFGLSTAGASAVGSTLLFGATVGAFVIGRLMGKFASKGVAILLMVAVPSIALIGLAQGNLLLLVLCIFMAGLGLSGGQVGLNAVSGTAYATNIRSTGAGWAAGVGRIGSAIGPGVGGVLLSLQMDPAALFAIASLPVAISALLAWILAQHLNKHPTIDQNVELAR